MQADLPAHHPPFAIFKSEVLGPPTPLRATITAAYRRGEQLAVQWLLSQVRGHGTTTTQAAQNLARGLVTAVREKRTRASGVDALMHQFSLSSEEGVALMCLAEALLRIPDKATANRLIADKIGKGDWRSHLGESPSLFVNAATWGLVVTGKLVSSASEERLASAITRLIAKGGEPLIRRGVDLAMRTLGNQFVTGQTIEEAIRNGRDNEARGYKYSYDMLGEAALTRQDADRYFAAYEEAIHAIGKAANGRGIRSGPGISVKLSALHPRYTRAQRGRVLVELQPRLRTLALLAKQYDIGLNIDAEESDRLELSLDLVESLAQDPELNGFDGIGIVVQAYQKRCPFVIDFLVDLGRRTGRKFMVRLVKGAYWDAEIKRAQVDGMPGYPVYTRKVYTDLSYLACAQRLLAATDVIYPQFATHNAHTLATIYTWAQQDGVDDYEFQCLHGMGETLYDQVVGTDKLDKACRIYAPVGTHETLLAYLVRRLLENGANSSFVSQIVDKRIAIEALLEDPIAGARRLGGQPHPAIALPRQMFGASRHNSMGIDLSNEDELRDVANALAQPQAWSAAPLLAGQVHFAQPAQVILNPAHRADVVGHVVEATPADVEAALVSAIAFAPDWQAVGCTSRAAALQRAADLYEVHRLELVGLAVREAGKSLPNAVAEVREAIDFLRYYAWQAKIDGDGVALGSVTCISPWNFPLAIFTGQVAAALAAGNVVLAKPAEQTPLIAHRAVQLMHSAGIPRAALQFLPGAGDVTGARLCEDPRVKGVLFTGSTEVAQRINRTLARRAVTEGADIPLVAETGGQNAMIVDSSALPEQVVQDVVASAFDSAGQRCSALRVLFLQEEIADKVIGMLQGAMKELNVGNPDRLATDIGPVIDRQAQADLLAHIERMKTSSLAHFSADLPGDSLGMFVAPTVLEIRSLAELTREVFGPVVHVIRYRRTDLPRVLEQIDASGFGLTLGVHSRIDETVDYIVARANVGNAYVNRNIVGAVVGVQPFGGEGKSGTGPKAGGPWYLRRLRRTAALETAHPPVSMPALDALRGWALGRGRHGLAAMAQQYAAATPLGTVTHLPGPTGERNTLRYAPRGSVACFADTEGTLLNELAAVLATGNRAVIADHTAALLPGDLPEAVREQVRFVDGVDRVPGDCQVALASSSVAAQVRLPLAALDGPLVSVIDATEDGTIPLWRLVAERTLCVNTTAAGGNASLMTLGA